MSNHRNYTSVLSTIKCHDEADGIGSAEPYLWTIAIRIGGDEIRQAPGDPFRLEGTPHYSFGNGSHGNLGGGMDEGDERSIPGSVGFFGGSVTPISLEILGNTIEVPAVLALIAVLMEEDNVSDSGAEAGHQALNQLVQDRVNGFLASLNLLDVYTEANNLIDGTSMSLEEGAVAVLKDMFGDVKDQLVNDSNSVVKNAIKNNQNIFENLWSWINADDLVGTEMFLFSTQELLDQGKEIEISSRLNEGDGDYELTGKFTLSSPVINIGDLPAGADRLEIEAISKRWSTTHNLYYIYYVGGEHEGQQWILHKYTGAILIRDGIKSFYVKAEDGSETEVPHAQHESGSHYMRTTPNDTTEDNLLSLPELGFYLEE